jgi:DNA-directed RNA polymerase specialized sigma24 family protein
VISANEGVVEVSFDDARLDLETVFRAQHERIARVITGVIRDPARAEELAVEVFLKWERTPKAHGEGAEGWLYRAAVRIALNELRRTAASFMPVVRELWFWNCQRKVRRLPSPIR